MLKRLKKYLVGEDSDTYAVSLVDEPAIEENFMFFKKEEGEKLEVLMDSDEKHLVCGAVLVPERPIYRNYDGEEFYVEFTKEAIEKMEQDFLKNYRQFNATVQHEEDVNEVYMVESWLKADAQLDKSLAMGLNPTLPVGTWFATFKVNNVDVWERIKSGELRGFSVEAMIDLQEVDFKKAEAKLEEETPAAVEEPTAEPVVEPVSEEPVEPTAEPTVEEPVEPVTEPTVEEPTPAEPTVEEPKQETNAEQLTQLAELINNLKVEIEALKTANVDLVGKVKGLESLPSAKPVSTNGKGAQGTSPYDAWRNMVKRSL